jgi:hypothetical protein
MGRLAIRHHRPAGGSLRKFIVRAASVKGRILQLPGRGERMAEVLVEYADSIVGENGAEYVARACGAETDNGMWHGWLEFVNTDSAEVLRSGRETTQPNRADTVYWATGLTPVYLEGALQRARRPMVRTPSAPPPVPYFDEPAPNFAPADSILDPFSAYRKGETLLRSQLRALSAWHLANIVRAHALSAAPASALDAMSAAELEEIIVSAVRRAEKASSRR